MCPQVKTIPVLVIRRLWSLNHTVKYFSLESGAVGNYPGTGNREILVMIFAGARGWHTSSIKGNWTCHEQSLTFDIQESDHCQAHPCAQRKSRSLLFFFFSSLLMRKVSTLQQLSFLTRRYNSQLSLLIFGRRACVVYT